MKPNIPVLYEDNHLLVVEKPANLPVQADASGDADMLTLLKAYIKEKYQKPGEVFLGLVHRLDRPVGGVMVFARTSKAAARLTEQFGSHTTKKCYAALTHGEPHPEAQLVDVLLKDERTHSSRVVKEGTPGAKRASLAYRTVAKKKGLSLLDVSLHTGRAHQIRVQMSHAGLPLWGDARYNPDSKPGQQIALWAYSLTFLHPTKKEPMTFTSIPKTAPWPEFHAELLRMAGEIPVLYQDEHILVAHKPRGLSTAKADGGRDSLEEKLSARYGNVLPAHRLDVNTEGLVLFAREESSLDALTQAIRDRLIRKYYACLVKGVPSPKEAVLEAYLLKDPSASTVKVYDTPHKGAKEIKTGYRVLSVNGGMSLVEVELFTGRTHQIRAHMALFGHPLLGDDKYGDWEWNRRHKAKTQALSAVRLELHFEKESPLAYLEGRGFTIHADFTQNS